MTDLFVAAVGLSITYKLLPDDELLQRTEKAIKIVWIPNLDDLIQLDKLLQLYSAKLDLLQWQGRIDEKMTMFKEEIRPKIEKTMEPFPEKAPARICLQNNILVYLVEYLKDCKRKNMVEEGSVVV